MNYFKQNIVKIMTDTKGVAAIELALILPVFLWLIFGSIELGYVFWGETSLSYGASYGARYAYTHPSASASDIANFALSQTNFSAGGPITYNVTLVPGVTADVQGTFTYTFMVVPMNPVNITIDVVQALQLAS